MGNQSRKELMEAYKNRRMEGGIYIIENTANNKVLLEWTTDLKGRKNRFEFGKVSQTCIHLKLQEDWNLYGGDSFEFKVLEELEQGENQTLKEYEADLLELKDIWKEKMETVEFYNEK